LSTACRIVGEPTSKFKEAVEMDPGILTEVHLRLDHIPAHERRHRPYNCHFGRLNTNLPDMPELREKSHDCKSVDFTVARESPVCLDPNPFNLRRQSHIS
jgi:hypothetical protein